MTPKSIKGSELEVLIAEQNAIYEDAGMACIGRYGVQAARMKEEWIIQSSLPDFEGPLAGGHHIVFDSKVCSQASFSWAPYRSATRGAKARQLKHMIRRSRFKAKCFFLFHWNERVMKTKTIPAATFVLPVIHDFDYWDRVESGEVGSINIDDCNRLGIEVEWTKRDRGTKYRPDYLTSLVGFTEIYTAALQKCGQKQPLLLGMD